MTDPGIPDLPTTFFLVRRAKEGEQEAQGELLHRYYPRVRKIVRLRLGKNLLGVLEATDILQDTFVAAIKAFDSGPGSPDRCRPPLIRDKFSWVARLLEVLKEQSGDPVVDAGCHALEPPADR